MIYNAVMKQCTLSKAEKKELCELYRQFPRAVIFVKENKVSFAQKYIKEDGNPGLFQTGYIYGALADVLKILLKDNKMELDFLINKYC